MEKLDSTIRFCLYARKSSESDERQAISIDSQINEMKKIADKDNLNICEIYRESCSAKKCNQRKVFIQMLKDIEQGVYSGIITWSADRLSRNAGDLGMLVDLIDEGRLEIIVTYSQIFTNNPNEKFLLMILGSQAKLENDNRSINIRRGKRNQCQLGLWPGQPPLGYISETIGSTRKISIDPKRGEFIKKLFQKIADGISVQKVIEWINNNTSLRTRNNKYIPQSVIYIMLRNKFYTGRFIVKGVEYQGTYEPLITSELFNKVQENLRPFRNVVHSQSHYSIARYLRCSLCGSPVHYSAKTKHLKNGRSKQHNYYKCSHQYNKDCEAGYVLEEEVFLNIAHNINAIDVSTIVFPEQIQDDIVRFERMCWNIYARMSESSVRLSIYPLKFEEVESDIVRLYLQNIILYAKPEKRHALFSLLLKYTSFDQIKLLPVVKRTNPKKDHLPMA